MADWTGPELTEFMEARKASPEQIAVALQRQPNTIRRWMSADGPFAGDDTRILQLALIGFFAEGERLGEVKPEAPLKVTMLVDRGAGTVQVSARQLARPPRQRESSSEEWVPVPLSSGWSR